ncbi:hypothetical protein Nepgr_015069 [Nepenthes gracilis]|uniref:Uncharacterized protein n=1 Tax=Nepenthes gracilis TaxID=150966 RepID=A0AAD3XQF0_NEPGR|nr:hypothetical protein Nepgr_015069 [Nepenthes gracilis]
MSSGANFNDRLCRICHIDLGYIIGYASRLGHPPPAKGGVPYRLARPLPLARRVWRPGSLLVALDREHPTSLANDVVFD